MEPLLITSIGVEDNWSLGSRRFGRSDYGPYRSVTIQFFHFLHSPRHYSHASCSLVVWIPLIDISTLPKERIEDLWTIHFAQQCGMESGTVRELVIFTWSYSSQRMIGEDTSMSLSTGFLSRSAWTTVKCLLAAAIWRFVCLNAFRVSVVRAPIKSRKAQEWKVQSWESRNVFRSYVAACRKMPKRTGGSSEKWIFVSCRVQDAWKTWYCYLSAYVGKGVFVARSIGVWWHRIL